MSNETTIQRSATPTWMKNLICSIWLMWSHIPSTPGRLSATNIQAYLVERLHGPEIESYIPEIRTIQRILADFRPLTRIAQEIDSEKVPPLIGGGWPEGSDDTAFLVALVRSWGENYHPDFWDPTLLSGGSDFDDPTSLDDSLDEFENETLVRVPEEGPPSFSFTKLEIKIALQLKGSLGWPRDFQEHGGDRNPWQMTHPRSRHGLPGELAIIKEMALRKRYAEESDSYDGDCSDIMDILMSRPWSTKTASEDLPKTSLRSRIKWNRNTSHAGHFNWDTIRWNSIYGSGTDFHAPMKLVRCVQRFIDTGDDTFRAQAEAILDDLCLPLDAGQIMALELGGENEQLGIATWHLGRFREAQRRLAIVVTHMKSIESLQEPLVELSLSGNGLNTPHAPEGVIESDGQTPWMALSLDQLRGLDPNDEYFINEFWCAGCRRAYIPVSEVASAIMSPRTGSIVDEDLVQTAVSRLRRVPSKSLIAAALTQKYHESNPDFEDSQLKIKQLIQGLTLTSSFMKSLAKLDADDARAVKTIAYDLQSGVSDLTFELIEQSADPNFRLVRATDNLGIVVHDTPRSLLLCYVSQCDDAYEWARRHRLQTTSTAGAVELVENASHSTPEIPTGPLIDGAGLETPASSSTESGINDADESHKFLVGNLVSHLELGRGSIIGWVGTLANVQFPDAVVPVHENSLAIAADIGEEQVSTYAKSLSYWQAFHHRLEHSTESRTTLTIQDWMGKFLPLIGFEPPSFQRAPLETDSRPFNISHIDGLALPVHIVGIDQGLDEVKEARRISPHALVQRYLNNWRAPWGLVSNGSVIRILMHKRYSPAGDYFEFNLQRMMDESESRSSIIEFNRLNSMLKMMIVHHRQRAFRPRRIDGSFYDMYSLMTTFTTIGVLHKKRPDHGSTYEETGGPSLQQVQRNPGTHRSSQEPARSPRIRRIK
jgi:hypothetical protein